jgi:hypothetical protein
MKHTLLLLALVASGHGASLSTNATGTIIYTYCSDTANPASCQPGGGTQSLTGGASLDFALTFPPIIGSERLTGFANYGGLFVQANSNTGILNRAPGGAANSTVSFVSGVEGGASFSDVIHFLNAPGIAFLDVTASCTCFKQDTAHASASFNVGAAHSFMQTGFPDPFTQHLVTQFALGGTLALSGNVGAGATDEVPFDENQGSSSAQASAGLGNFVVTDAAGAVIHPTYYTDSGTAYLGQAGFVPEPGTWLLVGLGLALAARLRVATGRPRRGRGLSTWRG